MTVKRVSLGELGATLARDLKALQKGVVRAAHKTAKRGVRIAKQNAPKAFGEIQDGILDIPHANGATLRSSAPHSGPVESGSRPHMPPVEAIEKWVRLRGMQGIDSAGRLTKKKGVGRTIQQRLRQHGTGNVLSDGSAVDIDAPRKVAWAIALKIAKSGTEPTWFMQRTTAALEPILDSQIKAALGEK